MTTRMPWRGEIVLIEGPGGDRAIMVVTCRFRRQMMGVLCSNEIEMATTHDLILRRAETGCRYDLLAQGELYGYFQPSQVVRALGTTRQARRLVRMFDAEDGDGMPLGGVHDPRRTFKHQELDRLRRACPLRPFLEGG